MPNSTCSALLRIRRSSRYISSTGLLPSAVCLSRQLLLCIFNLTGVQNPMDWVHGLGSSHFARRYFGNRFFFLFLRVLRCFSSPGFLKQAIDSPECTCALPHVGSPHSDICGSKVICTLPQLIAACHVLHRLLVPRHPPYALSHLTFGLFLSRSASSSFLAHSVEYLCTLPHSLVRFLASQTKNFAFLVSRQS